MQAERDSNGAIIQHWKPSEIENVIIPVLDMDKQRELAEMVQKSFALRRQSKQLLSLIHIYLFDMFRLHWPNKSYWLYQKYSQFLSSK